MQIKLTHVEKKLIRSIIHHVEVMVSHIESDARIPEFSTWQASVCPALSKKAFGAAQPAWNVFYVFALRLDREVFNVCLLVKGKTIKVLQNFVF